jgi:predicted SnoaL-like aldol condensation-catalyzing enzyme
LGVAEERLDITNGSTAANQRADAARVKFVELLNVIGDNDMVVVYVRQTWTGKDGQHHQALGFDMFRLQDGMIAEHWDAD